VVFGVVVITAEQDNNLNYRRSLSSITNNKNAIALDHYKQQNRDRPFPSQIDRTQIFTFERLGFPLSIQSIKAAITLMIAADQQQDNLDGV